jgi:hypothetical protein
MNRLTDRKSIIEELVASLEDWDFEMILDYAQNLYEERLIAMSDEELNAEYEWYTG